MIEPLSLEEFLDKKRDYSPLVVHLTRNGIDETGNLCVSAKDVLEAILDERMLRAYNYFCIFKEGIQNLEDSLRGRFKVVCFTETPIDQIEVLLKPVYGRNVTFEPYGLVFKKWPSWAIQPELWFIVKIRR